MTNTGPFLPDLIFIETLKAYHPQMTHSQLESLHPLAKEIGDKIASDFKPNENYFSDEDLKAITEKALKMMVHSSMSLDPSELLKYWNQAVVDFHRNRYWGFIPQSAKPKRAMTEDQKIRKEMLSYIWVFVQSMIVLKTAVYFFGLEYADKREPINLFLLLAAIGTSFGSLIFFAYRKSRKQKHFENSEQTAEKKD